MEKQIKPQAAFADKGSQRVLRDSLEGLAAQIGKRTAGLANAVDDQRHEIPMLVASQSHTDRPAGTPGMLWMPVDLNKLYTYHAGTGLFLSSMPLIQNGNNVVAVVSGSTYRITRIGLPNYTYLEYVKVCLFSVGGAFSGTARAYQIGVGSIGAQSFSLSAVDYAEVNVVVETAFLSVLGVEVRIEVSSGSLPDVAAYACYREMI